MKGRLWAFSGLDGAGKTTQIELLEAELAASGGRTRRIWVRGGYTPLFSWLKDAVRRLLPAALPPAGRTEERERRFRSDFLRRLWLAMAMMELIVYCGIWVRLLQLTGSDVITDRWADDTEIDFALNFPGEEFRGTILWRCFLRVIPRPTVHFVLVVPVEEALRRSEKKREPFPDTAAVLERRLALYEGVIAGRNVVRIDGLGAKDALHRMIVDHCREIG